MKINLIKWELVKPGSKVDLNFVKSNHTMPSYYIKNDIDLNNFTVYNPLTGLIENYNLSKQDIVEVDIDKKSDSNYNYPKPNIDIDEMVVFNEAINTPQYLFTSEKIFKIKDFDSNFKTCTLFSINNKFILHNIHWDDITPISSIFNLNNIINENEIGLKFKSKTITVGNYQLYIKNDKYRKFMIIIVFDINTREYGISLIDTRFIFPNFMDQLDLVERKINKCFILILQKSYPESIPEKGETYTRIDMEKDGMLVGKKFKFNNLSCLYDLYFNNIFTDPSNNIFANKEEAKNAAMDRQKKIKSVMSCMNKFDKYCQRKDESLK